MKISKWLLAAAAGLALASCGKKDGAGSAGSAENAAAAKTAAASPLDKDYRLKDGEAVSADDLLAIFPAPVRPTYEDAAYDEKLGATVITNLRFADDDDGEGMLVERAEIYGADMEAIKRVKSAEASSADAPYENVFQKVRLLGVTAEGFDDEESSLSIGGVEFDKLAIRQGGIEGDGNDVARFFNAMSLGGLYFKDLALAAETEDSPSINMTVPDLRFVSIAGGKLGAVIAKDLDYTLVQDAQSLEVMRQAMGPQGAALMNSPLMAMIAPENQRVTLDTMEWRDIDLSGLMAWGLKGEEPPTSEKDLIDLGVMKAADMSTYVNGKKAAFIEEATLTAGKFTWLIPSDIRADTKGATYDFTAYAPAEQPEVLSILQDHGLDKVTGDGYFEWKWNADKGGAQLDYVANAKGLADFSTKLALEDLKLEDMGKAKEDGGDDASSGALKSFSIAIKDEKALDAIFALSALQMGGTAEELRQSAPAMIRLSGLQAAQINPRMTGYIDAIADFVAKGGTLEITATPAEPVSFYSLRGNAVAPGELPNILDLNVIHKE